jgi:hypothetical protein
MGVKTGRPRGRPPGAPNKATSERQATIAASGKTPLEFMLDVMRNEQADIAARFEAAKAAAPYVHPRLSAVDAKVDARGVREWLLTED